MLNGHREMSGKHTRTAAHSRIVYTMVNIHLQTVHVVNVQPGNPISGLAEIIRFPSRHYTGITSILSAVSDKDAS